MIPVASRAAIIVEAVAKDASAISSMVLLDQNLISVKLSIRWSSLLISLSKSSFDTCGVYRGSIDCTEH
jgi:hypothetical protein